MRKLNTADVFAALRIVKAAGLKEQLKPVLRKISEGKMSVSDIGIETILAAVEGLSDKGAENAFYTFLSAPFELKEEDIAALPPAELFKKLKELADENDLKSFFTSLSALIISR